LALKEEEEDDDDDRWTAVHWGNCTKKIRRCTFQRKRPIEEQGPPRNFGSSDGWTITGFLLPFGWHAREEKLKIQNQAEKSCSTAMRTKAVAIKLTPMHLYYTVGRLWRCRSLCIPARNAKHYFLR